MGGLLEVLDGPDVVKRLGFRVRQEGLHPGGGAALGASSGRLWACEGPVRVPAARASTGYRARLVRSRRRCPSG